MFFDIKLNLSITEKFIRSTRIADIFCRNWITRFFFYEERTKVRKSDKFVWSFGAGISFLESGEWVGEVATVEPVKFPICISCCRSDCRRKFYFWSCTVESHKIGSCIPDETILTIGTISCFTIVFERSICREFMDEIVEFSLIFEKLIDLWILSWPVDIEFFSMDTISKSTCFRLHESDSMRKWRKQKQKTEKNNLFHIKVSYR